MFSVKADHKTPTGHHPGSCDPTTHSLEWQAVGSLCTFVTPYRWNTNGVAVELLAKNNATMWPSLNSELKPTRSYEPKRGKKGSIQLYNCQMNRRLDLYPNQPG